MERKLFIVRHAKSSWDNEGLADIDRPLANRGLRNAGEMAERLLAKKMIPQLLLSSPANRALNTALIMSKIWGTRAENFQIHETLYDASILDIEQVIAGVPSDIKSLAIFGHNPSSTAYGNMFLKHRLDNLPTAGVVIVTLESKNWEGIRRKHVKETYVDYPKRK